MRKPETLLPGKGTLSDMRKKGISTSERGCDLHLAGYMIPKWNF